MSTLPATTADYLEAAAQTFAQAKRLARRRGHADLSLAAMMLDTALRCRAIAQSRSSMRGYA